MTPREFVESFGRYLFGWMAFMGWAMFVFVLILRISGFALYATTFESVIKETNPVWDKAARDAMNSGEGGFVIRIGADEDETP